MLPQKIAQLLAQGHWANAIDLCHQQLARQPDDARTMALLGSALCQSGALAEGKTWLSRALQRQPGLVSAQVDLGRARRLSGQAAAAVGLLEKANRAAPGQLPIINELALAQRAAGRPAEAARLLQRALDSAAHHRGLRVNLANALREAGRLQPALDHFETLLASGPADAPLLNSYGLALAAAERSDEAEASFMRALELAQMPAADRPAGQPTPDQVQAGIWGNLGATLSSTGRWTEAVAAFEQSLALVRAQPGIRNHLASAQRELGQLQQAEANLRETVAQFPSDPHGWRNLVALLEESNRVEDALQTLDQAEVHIQNDSSMVILRARCERRSGELIAAQDRLRKLADGPMEPELRRRKWLELAQVLDALAQYKDAFKFFRKARDLQRKSLPPLPDNRYERWTDQLVRAPLPTPRSSKDQSGPIFVVGFPRSGTTLLDQFLDGHSRLQTVEESAALENQLEALEGGGLSYPADLEQCPDEKVAVAREHYFQTLCGGAPPDEGRRLVDRMPINMLHLPLIQRLWSGGRIIHLKRHPADVCLSAFMQDFRINALSAHFLKLVDTVNFASRVFQVWQRWQAVYSEHIFELRYEDLVTDPEPQLRQLLDFLELPFESAVLDHVATARARVEIRTASYQQASQPLYQRSVFRWKNYRRQLEPVAVQLAAMARMQGYDFS